MTAHRAPMAHKRHHSTLDWQAIYTSAAFLLALFGFWLLAALTVTGSR